MKSVLFVSHDRDLRAVGTRVLERAGFRVTAAAHGGHAQLACVERGAFDVLVIEDRLPEASGSVIASRLRRLCPGLDVVRMCDAQPAAGSGEGIALVRPFTADHLIAAVQVRRRTITR
jgi:DNA-binding response OmpR family regulator